MPEVERSKPVLDGRGDGSEQHTFCSPAAVRMRCGEDLARGCAAIHLALEDASTSLR